MRIDGLDKQMNGLQREETFFILAGRSIGGTKVLLSGTSITHITRMVEPFISFASEIFNHFCRRGYGQLRPWNAGINVVCALRKPENIMDTNRRRYTISKMVLLFSSHDGLVGLVEV